MLGGHIHVGGQLSTRIAKDAAELTIETVITYLDSILFIPGDINDDEVLNIIDVILLIDFILENTNPNDEWLVIADINDDGIVNVLDVILIVDNILKGWRLLFFPLQFLQIFLHNSNFVMISLICESQH